MAPESDHDFMAWGTASRWVAFPDGEQRNKAGKMCLLLLPADEVRLFVRTWCARSWAGNPQPSAPRPAAQPLSNPPLLPLPPHPGVLGAASGGERPSAVPGVGESKVFFSFGWPDLAVPAVRNASDPVPLPATASCGPRADSTAHQLAAIYFFSNPSPPSLSLSQKQQQQHCGGGGTKRCLSPPGTRGRIWRCPLPTKSEGTAPFSAFPSSSPPPPKK